MSDVALSVPTLAAFDPVGWHYTQQLTQRANEATGLTRDLLLAKLEKALAELNTRFDAAQLSGLPATAPAASLPSPLAQLLQKMMRVPGKTQPNKPNAWCAESPLSQQFRKQLGQIRVQTQVAQAIAQAPLNAGPINSHMLVLRSLCLMREASPDYLGRFMAYLDTLLCLEDSGRLKTKIKKNFDHSKRQSVDF